MNNSTGIRYRRIKILESNIKRDESYIRELGGDISKLTTSVPRIRRLGTKVKNHKISGEHIGFQKGHEGKGNADICLKN